MSIMYLNGQFIDEQNAVVSVNDAGYYYGDGIYEYVFVYNEKLIDVDWHLDRLMASLQKAYIKNCPSKEEILNIMKTLIEKNNEIKIGSIYLQITRGIAPRTHKFFALNLQPQIMMKFSPEKLPTKPAEWKCGVVNDPRRTRRDIKMTSLMPMVLSKYDVEAKGFDDVIYFNKDLNSITEGCSFNVWMVDNKGTLITAPLGEEILAGITRKRLIEIAKESGYKVEERYFTKEEFYSASEAFASDSGDFVASIIDVDNKQIGDGKTGKITQDLFEKYIKFVKE